nr:hypothetical protein BaRGS_034991 [Batillaria attramentaria]
MVRSVAVEELLTPIPSRDGETFWGQPVEFISTSDTQVDVAFALHDLVDSYHELVLRLKTDLQEDRDTRADIVQLACDDEVDEGRRAHDLDI